MRRQEIRRFPTRLHTCGAVKFHYVKLVVCASILDPAVAGFFVCPVSWARIGETWPRGRLVKPFETVQTCELACSSCIARGARATRPWWRSASGCSPRWASSERLPSLDPAPRRLRRGASRHSASQSARGALIQPGQYRTRRGARRGRVLPVTRLPSTTTNSLHGAPASNTAPAACRSPPAAGACSRRAPCSISRSAGGRGTPTWWGRRPASWAAWPWQMATTSLPGSAPGGQQAARVGVDGQVLHWARGSTARTPRRGRPAGALRGLRLAQPCSYRP